MLKRSCPVPVAMSRYLFLCVSLLRVDWMRVGGYRGRYLS